METLKDLITFVTRKGLSEKEIFGKEKSKQRDLFTAVASGAVTTDDMALKRLFSMNSKQDGNLYRKTKSRLIERLYNLVPNIEVKDDGFSASTIAKKQCIIDLAIAEILMSGGAVISSRDKYKSILAKAEHFSFTQKALNACEALLYQYSMGKNAMELAFYEKKKEELSACAQAEKESDDLSRITNSILSRYSSPNEQQMQEIQRTCSQAILLSEKFPESFKLRTKAARLSIYYAMLRSDFIKGIAITEDFLRYVEENRHLINRGLYTGFNGLIVQCATAMRNYEKGKEALEKVRSSETIGTANWRISLLEEVFFFLCTGHYNESAKSLIRLAPYENLLKNHQSEKYRIYRAYLSILNQIGACTVQHESIPRYKSKDVFTDWEVINHDKQGLNIHTTIHYFLLMLIEQNLHGLSARTDTTRVYRLNHLTNQPRSAALFFRLERLSEMDFDYNKIEHYAVRRGFLLNDTPPLENNEIIPFDIIWALCEPLVNAVKNSIISVQKGKKRTR